MAAANSPKKIAAARARRLDEATEALRSLGFSARQSNEVAGYVLLSLLDLGAEAPWSAAQSPLRGITPMITFIR